jgi:uncharacterized membrane protein YhaH (DUF805 family)
MEGLRPFSRYFDFHGRSGRAEFWQFTGLVWIAMLVAIGIESQISNDFGLISTLISVLTFVPTTSVTVRRLHDTDNSGWSIAIFYGLTIVGLFMTFAAKAEGQISQKGIPLILFALGSYIYMMVKPGDDHENRFGPPDGVEEPEYGGPVDLQHTIPMAAAESTAPSLDTSIDQIERLGSLRDKGLLSDEEFASQKAAILARC